MDFLFFLLIFVLLVILAIPTQPEENDNNNKELNLFSLSTCTDYRTFFYDRHQWIYRQVSETEQYLVCAMCGKRPNKDEK